MALLLYDCVEHVCQCVQIRLYITKPYSMHILYIKLQTAPVHVRTMRAQLLSRG